MNVTKSFYTYNMAEEYKEIKMTLNEYQVGAHKTRDIGNTPKILYPALGLGGETGEVLDKLKKVLRDKQGKISKDDIKEIAKELGDVLWYVAELAFDLGFTLEEIATMNLFKLKDRVARDKIHGSGDNR